MNPTGNFAALLPLLASAGVRFIVIGGGAAIAHGLSRVTYDVDILYDRADDNLEALAQALAPHSPYPRGAPPGLPFRWDAATLRGGLNFTLTTALGDLDLFAEVPGARSHQELLPRSELLNVFGTDCRFVDLPALIDLKRAAGRPKDFEAIAELEALRDERG